MFYPGRNAYFDPLGADSEDDGMEVYGLACKKDPADVKIVYPCYMLALKPNQKE
jgi:hypothetical protein